MDYKRILGSIIGNILSVVGVSLSLEQINQIVSIICMVVGLLITIVCSIVIPVVKWWKTAKADGHIDESELDELGNILQSGKEDVQKEKEKGDRNEQN